MPEPIQAGLWGALAGSALVLGAIAAITIRIPRRIVALIMAFGALQTGEIGEGPSQARVPRPQGLLESSHGSRV